MTDGIKSPPRPRLAVRIGVTGHRVPPKLPAGAVRAIEETVVKVLDTVMAAAAEVRGQHADAFAPISPVAETDCDGAREAATPPAETTIVSSLAEGADQIVARAGLAKGWALEAVLPFSAGEYVNDFEAPETAALFAELTRRARSTFVLPGSRADPTRAYEAAGLVMLASSDILIAVWNGAVGDGRGGTAETVARALADGMPVVVIDPAQPDAATIRWNGFEALAPASTRSGDVPSRPLGALGMVAAEILAPPPQTPRVSKPGPRAAMTRFVRALLPGHQHHDPGDTGTEIALATYLAETEVSRLPMLARVYPLFLSLFTDRKFGRGDRRASPYVGQAEAEWAGFLGACPPPAAALVAAIGTTLLPAFAFADRLAGHYQLRYRGAFILSYLLAAVAVALALAGLLPAVSKAIAWKAGFTFVEVIIIGIILWVFVQGSAMRWHARFLEYRRLAEVLRPMRMLALLGTADPIGRAPGPHVTERSFVPWYARAVRRMLPLPDATADAGYMAAVRAAAANRDSTSEIEGQIDYHKTTIRRMGTLDHKLHTYGEWLFRLTLYLGIFLLCLFAAARLAGLDVDDAFKSGIRACIKYGATFCMALFPTLGAALSAIRVQGDFGIYAERSRKTEKALTQIQDAMIAEGAACVSADPAARKDALADFALLADRIAKASDAMQGDLARWHALSSTRPLALPA